MWTIIKLLFFIALIYGAYWLYVQFNNQEQAKKDEADFNKTHETVEFRR